MNPSRAAGLASTVGALTAYLLVGPWPCSRGSARCGLVAYDYGRDVTVFPYQAVVTMIIFAGVAGLGTWFWIERERSPMPVRVGVSTILLCLSGLGIAGLGGMVGIGAPFVVPLLWLAARDAGTWGRFGWTLVASLCAASGSWLLTMPLHIEWSKPFAMWVSLATASIFLLTTRSRRTSV